MLFKRNLISHRRHLSAIAASELCAFPHLLDPIFNIGQKLFRLLHGLLRISEVMSSHEEKDTYSKVPAALVLRKRNKVT